MNRKSLTIAATTVTAVSSAVLVAKKVKNNKKDETARAFIIPMVIMKLLPDLKDQKVLKIKMRI